MTDGESRRLVQEAEAALREASRQYGKSSVTIGGRVYPAKVASGGTDGRCSDFMSPQDCHLMFNLCDPVLCPESRCDFGGSYRVDNVVQSGIIGSLLLCLPNVDEGIMIPVCLTGVHAGIEGYLSILTATRNCLQESLDSGRTMGICDEIQSVYMCEFFWKQAIPLMEIGIPKLFQMAIGQGTRGGGEYMTVQHSWDNMMSSIDYFKESYAVNAMKAFNERSTQEVGGELCKMFVSARYPASSSFFDKLLEPDSPPQYTAWFSENKVTTATVPPVSHYKVYYHIYAGKDRGRNYVVYLKATPEPGLVRMAERYVVDRNFIPAGQQVDITRDFTATSGYSQLCVSIDGQEECGFDRVCLLYTSPSPRDRTRSRMPSSA